MEHLHFPNESTEYRQARDALLAEKMELRRQIERVAGPATETISLKWPPRA